MTKKNKHVYKKKVKNDKIKIILFVLFLIIFLFSLFNLIKWSIYNIKSKIIINNIVSDYVDKEAIIDKNENIDKKDKVNINPINFEELKKLNSDIIGWIQIDNTSINYPIVQTTDNDFYLHKDIKKKYSTCGWIFMDYRNLNDFLDYNTVIYGHNIKSGLMFADLVKLYNNKLGKDIVINIYTEECHKKYKVFSSYMEEPNDESINTLIIDEDTQSKYIQKMLKKSSIIYNVDPDPSSKVLTLSTCDYSGNNRILVHSALILEEKFEK